MIKALFKVMHSGDDGMIEKIQRLMDLVAHASKNDGQVSIDLQKITDLHNEWIVSRSKRQKVDSFFYKMLVAITLGRFDASSKE